MPNTKIVIIGAGPTGLAAGYRLHELGYDDWVILEANDYVGGLAASFTDENGFTFDIGGHVIFSHFPYYDDLLERLLGDNYTALQREAWVWMQDRFIPYPFQNHIRYLEPQTIFDCLVGLVRAQQQQHPEPRNFREWVEAVMGPGIAKHFMIPYNFKVWAMPAEQMNFEWISERVSVLDIETLLRSIILDEEAVPWGPNDTFKYPLHGGTGYLYQMLRRFVEGHLELNTRVLSVDPAEKRVRTSDGRVWSYDLLLSTMPLNHLVASIESAPDAVRQAANNLRWTGSHIVGVGIDRPAMTTKNWIYFPEPGVPFYRVSYLSNYSRYMTPEPNQTLFLTETSYSDFKSEPVEQIVERVVDALVATRLMDEGDRNRIVTTWKCSPDMSYPVPTVTRDTSLGTIQPWLHDHAIWSRGRFGAWLYEIGNMDHSAMQGVEFVNHVLLGDPETVWIPRGQGASGEGIR